MGEKPASVTSDDLDKMLVKRFSPPAWALFFEFPDGTGSRKNRTADAVAYSLFPSQGLELHGIEKKVSRSDWLRELKDPKKADAVGKYCDRWWVVAPKGVVDVKEMPSPWGLMVTKKDSLVIAKQADKLPAKTMDRPFLASLMRQINERWIPKSQVNPIINQTHSDSYKLGYENGKNAVNYETDRPVLEQKVRAAQMELDGLRRDIAAFEEKSGVTMQRYNMGRIGEAVAILIRLGVKNADLAQMLQHIDRNLEMARREIGDSMKTVERYLPLFEGEPKV